MKVLKKLAKVIPLGVALGCTSLVGTVAAHHSHAMFDDSQEVTLNGAVTDVRYANPHVYLFMEVEDTPGEAENWAIEMSHIGNMINRGVTNKTITPGDDLVIVVNPLRNGQTGGNYTRIISINGIENATEGSSWSPAS